MASAVDALVLSGIIGAFLFAGSRFAGPKTAALVAAEGLRAVQTLWAPAVGLGVLLAVVYATAFGMLGRTPGRMVAGLRLVDDSGLAPSPGRAALRALVALFSFILFLGGFWWALVDRRRQTLHDKVASTYVVRPI